MTQAFNLGLLANNVNSSGKLDGTTGLTTSVVANTIGSAASTALTLQSAGTTAITVDTSQNVGIGVTPSAWTSASVAQLGARGSVWYYSGGSMHMSLNAYSVAGTDKYIQTDTAADYYQYAGGHFFRYAASGTAGNNISWTTGMTLDSSGNLLVGCTSPPSASVSGVQWSNPTVVQSKISTGSGTGAFTALAFYNGNGQVGRIDTSGSSTAYVTSSDYRLKENVAPMTGALAKVSQLKPVTYKWKVDGKDGEGFIAHELSEICPDAVLGEKDAVDEEGNPKYQGIDVSFLVATLTAAIQELKAINDTQAETINALTARIVVLEGK